MWAMRILALARTSRCAMVGVGTRKARAISSVESPPRVRRVSATCASVARAGWQQVKIRRSLSSATGVSSSAANSICRAISSCICVSRERRRSRSIALCRAVETSHAAGFAGSPSPRHCSSAAAYASCSASSATSKSPRRRMRVAKIRPCSVRTISSMRMVAPGGKATPPDGRAHPLRLFRLYRPDGPYLDRMTHPQQRVTVDDREHFVEVFRLHDAVAAELLLGLGKRPVRGHRLATLHPHGGGGAAHLQRVAALVEATFAEAFAVFDGGPVGGGPLLRGQGSPLFLVPAHEQHIAHAVMSSPRAQWTRLGLGKPVGSGRGARKVTAIATAPSPMPNEPRKSQK